MADNSQSGELETGATMLDTAPLMRDSALHGRGGGFERRLETSLARGEATTAGIGGSSSAWSLLSENADELSDGACFEVDVLVVAGAFSSLENGRAGRLGIERPLPLLPGDGGVSGWLQSCFVCCGGV